jgi:uncharacterized Rmd1/YagE family protein
MKRKTLISKIEKDIKELKNIKKESYKNLDDARKLPDDPSIGVDVFKDGFLNENPLLKTERLEGYNHTIGYCEGSIYKLKEVVFFLKISKKQYDKFKKDQLKIKKENKKTFEDLKNRLNENPK